MTIMSIDIETYSPQDLKKVGVYRYVDDPGFEVLLLAYAYDDGAVSLIDFTHDPDPKELKEITRALTSPDVIKAAWNANFERTCLAKALGRPMPPDQWRCTAVHASLLGLPRSLEDAGRVLGLEEDKRKMAEGKALIKYFSVPCKPTRTNGQRTRNLPEHDPLRWQTYKDYCKQDVVTERAIRYKLSRFPVPHSEQRLWEIDQDINDRGVKVDLALVSSALEADSDYRACLEREAMALTGLDNPNSVAQLKDWIATETGIDVHEMGLNKGTVEQLQDQVEDPKVSRLLQIRSELGKTSTSKYSAMERAVCSDGRIRGLIQFYGANRTGRFAGRLVQIQNLPKNFLPDLDLARKLLSEQRHGDMDLLFGNIPDTLSQLIRTALVPEKGNLFYVADFSAIEARVLAWMAKEKWRMDVFSSHGKIYEASASQMFGVPLEKIKKGQPEYALRQKGKVAELALGYGGGENALIAMGALSQGLSEDELKPLVTAWRKASPNIIRFWWEVGAAAIEAVKDPGVAQQAGGFNLYFTYESGILFMLLPSGRRLAYVKPRITENDYGREQLTFEGIVGTSGGKWGRIDTYGPKLVENAIQAISRDCLTYAIENLAAEGYRIVMHVHDEVIIEAPQDHADARLEAIERTMCRVPPWAEGLPLNADGYHCDYYRKE